MVNQSKACRAAQHFIFCTAFCAPVTAPHNRRSPCGIVGFSRSAAWLYIIDIGLTLGEPVH
jgi:hypothetical protein